MTWDAGTGETIGRAELDRRCAVLCAQGVPRGTQRDPVRIAAAVVMADDPAFDRAAAVRSALDPFHAAYPLDHYDEATAVITLLQVADWLDADAAAGITRIAR